MGQMQVAPPQVTDTRSTLSTRRRVTRLQLAGALFNWLVWLLVAFLVLSQFLSVVWDTTTTQVPASYGQSPRKGLTTISGLNDEPYSDRVIACVLQGRSYLPVTVSDAIALGTTKLINTTGASINGYRVVKRVMSSLSPAARALYTHSCSTIASTLDAILTRCTLLGYNVTSDNLRIVDDIGSSNTYLIENSLPVLVMPYWDSCLTGRFAIPGADGSACMLRLVGTYISVTAPIPYAVAVNRTAREGKTVEWLKRPGGKWRNGWYEDLEGAKWFSDVTTDGKDDSSPDLTLTQYNMLTGEELVCDDLKKVCVDVRRTLGDHAQLQHRTDDADGGHRLEWETTVYDWETLLSNVIAFQILFRWMLAMITLVRGYRLGVSDWHNAGIGCLAHCYSFKFMPFLLLPRLKMTLFAFWTTGCVFEGSQRVLAEAWFVSYPAIVEMVLLYFSLLNFLAKLCRLRVSDAMFGPTLIFLCGLHWFREALANSGWLDFDGRVVTLISVAKFSEVSILDFFTSSLTLRTNGNAKSIFGAKLAAFALGGLLPFLWSLRGCIKKAAGGNSASRIEGILAIRMQNTGGLGRVRPRTATTRGSEHSTEDDALQAVDGYELIRLGFLVFGDHGGASGNMRNDSNRARRSYLIRVDDWDLLTLMAPMRKLTHLWNYRVKVFALQGSTLGKLTGTVAGEPEMFHIDDRRIQEIHWWEVSSRSLE